MNKGWPGRYNYKWHLTFSLEAGQGHVPCRKGGNSCPAVFDGDGAWGVCGHQPHMGTQETLTGDPNNRVPSRRESHQRGQSQKLLERSHRSRPLCNGYTVSQNSHACPRTAQELIFWKRGFLPFGQATLLVVTGFLLAWSLSRWMTIFLSLNSSICKMGMFTVPSRVPCESSMERIAPIRAL